MTTFSQRLFLTCLDQHTLLSDLLVLTSDSSASRTLLHINEDQMKESQPELTPHFKLKHTTGTSEWDLSLKQQIYWSSWSKLLVWSKQGPDLNVPTLL